MANTKPETPIVTPGAQGVQTPPNVPVLTNVMQHTQEALKNVTGNTEVVRIPEESALALSIYTMVDLFSKLHAEQEEKLTEKEKSIKEATKPFVALLGNKNIGQITGGELGKLLVQSKPFLPAAAQLIIENPSILRFMSNPQKQNIGTFKAVESELTQKAKNAEDWIKGFTEEEKKELGQKFKQIPELIEKEGKKDNKDDKQGREPSEIQNKAPETKEEKKIGWLKSTVTKIKNIPHEIKAWFKGLWSDIVAAFTGKQVKEEKKQ